MKQKRDGAELAYIKQALALFSSHVRVGVAQNESERWQQTGGHLSKSHVQERQQRSTCKEVALSRAVPPHCANRQLETCMQLQGLTSCLTNNVVAGAEGPDLRLVSVRFEALDYNLQGNPDL